MKTLYQYATPSGSASVRLVKRKIVQPFAVVIDLPAHYVSFRSFTNGELAFAYYAESVEMVISAEPVRALA
jgi:hypothetical protein